MATNLDLPLDTIIEMNKQGEHRTRGGRGGRGRRGQRNFGLIGNIRKPNHNQNGGAFRITTRGTFRNSAAPYTRRAETHEEKEYVLNDEDTLWEHDLYEEEEEDEGMDIIENNNSLFQNQGRGTGTTIQVSNLEYSVNEQDLKDLFGTVGVIKKVGIKYDRSGRSEGIAKVVFSSNSECLQAIKQYNGVSLDGHPLSISLLSSAARNRDVLPQRRVVRNVQNFRISNNSFRGRGRGRGRSFRGRGGRRFSGASLSVDSLDAESLDAELDSYQQQK